MRKIGDTIALNVMAEYPFGIAAHCEAKMHWDFDALPEVQELHKQLNEGLVSYKDFAHTILVMWDEHHKSILGEM